MTPSHITFLVAQINGQHHTYNQQPYVRRNMDRWNKAWKNEKDVGEWRTTSLYRINVKLNQISMLLGEMGRVI